MDKLSKFRPSVSLLRVHCALCFTVVTTNALYYLFTYLLTYCHKTSTAVYPVPRYFFTVNTVDEILSTAHPYMPLDIFLKKSSIVTIINGITVMVLKPLTATE